MAQVEKEKLEKLYKEDKLPIVKIAEILGFDRGTISSWMDEYNIEKRTYSERTKLVWENMDEEQKQKQVAAAHKKNKELAQKGKHPFQKVWEEKPEEMRKIVKRHIPEVISKRTNGMKGVTGSDHPNWNPDLTPEEREKKRRKLNKINWREKVFEKDNYTCQICNDDTGGNLVAHHKYSYMAYPDKRTDIDNGVTLCESCHKKFHKKYGWGENTAEQFEEFKAVVCSG